jgi:hypothetical protein
VLAKNPFHLALGLTSLALIFIVPVAMGCEIYRSGGIPAGCRPTDTVYWDRASIGVAALAVAGYFWHRAIKSIRRTSPARF